MQKSALAEMCFPNRETPSQGLRQNNRAYRTQCLQKIVLTENSAYRKQCLQITVLTDNSANRRQCLHTALTENSAYNKKMFTQLPHKILGTERQLPRLPLQAPFTYFCPSKRPLLIFAEPNTSASVQPYDRTYTCLKDQVPPGQLFCLLLQHHLFLVLPLSGSERPLICLCFGKHHIFPSLFLCHWPCRYQCYMTRVGLNQRIYVHTAYTYTAYIRGLNQPYICVYNQPYTYTVYIRGLN